MKQIVWTEDMPDCDLDEEGRHGEGVYNTPARRDDPLTGGRWANLCRDCFEEHNGLDTSVTEERVAPPAEVLAIARYWAGADSRPRPLESGAWRAVQHDDGVPGFVYDIYPPGTEYPVIEDSGRPCGRNRRDDWVVRCVNDAPDAWFTVSLDGVKRGYGGEVRVW